MRYIRTNWEDRKTVVNATRLNNIENGIETASNEINNLSSDVNGLQDRLVVLESNLGYKTTKDLGNEYDLNNLKTNGKYRIINAINTPNSTAEFLVDVIVHGTYIIQIARTFNGIIYQREFVSNTWKDWTRLLNNRDLTSLEDKITALTNRVTTTETNIGELQTKGIELTNRLVDLETNLGYKTTKRLVDGTDCNTVITNGKYSLYNGLNVPSLSSPTTFLVDVIATPSLDTIIQIAQGVGGLIFRRECNNNTWSEWKKILGIDDFNALEGMITTTATRLLTAENNITTLQTDLDTAEENIKNLQTAIGTGSSENSLTARVATNEDNIAKLTERVSTTETDITNLKDEDTRINERLTELESDVTTSTDDLRDELQTNIDNIASTAQSNLDQVKQELQGNIDTTKAELQGNIDANHQSVTTEIISIKDLIDALGIQLTAVDGDLQAHKIDTQAHKDIREVIGDNTSLLTESKEIVGAINELFMSGGNGIAYGVLSGNDKLLRLTANETTNTLDVGIALNPNATEVYLMGLRLFRDKDYTIEGTNIILTTTLLVGEYIDVFVKEEVVIDLSEGTFVETHVRFVATEPTSSFIISESLGRGKVVMYQEGIRLYENYDYTLDRGTKEVTLVQPLEVGEYIDYTIKMNTGTNITEIYDTIEEVVAQKENIALLPTIVENVNGSIKSIEATEVDNQIKITKNDGSTENIDIKGVSSSELEEVKTSIDNMKDGEIEGSLQKQINVLSNEGKISQQWQIKHGYKGRFFREIFSSGTNLDDVKTNVFCYTQGGDSLTGLPPSVTTSANGIFECNCNYLSDGSIYSVVQTYTRINFGTWVREFSGADKVWNEWKKLSFITETLIANGVFRGGETITLSEPITNFNKLTFFFSDAGGSPNHAETATIIPYIHPNNFTADNNITYAGYGYNGIWEITTKESGTKLEVTTLGSSYVRKVFGIKEG